MIKSFLFSLSLHPPHLTTEKLLIYPFITHSLFIVPDPSLKDIAVALISYVLKYYGLCHSRKPFCVQPSDSYFLNPLYHGRLLLPTCFQPSLPSQLVKTNTWFGGQRLRCRNQGEEGVETIQSSPPIRQAPLVKATLVEPWTASSSQSGHVVCPQGQARGRRCKEVSEWVEEEKGEVKVRKRESHSHTGCDCPLMGTAWELGPRKIHA